MTGRHVLVIGGGLAGISAAIQLREAGTRVTLLEARHWLGGATCSFTRGDKVIDNGQHVFLRCCTAYQDLLARLGMTGSVAMQERFDVTVLTPGGQARLRRSALPAPLHLAGALARYKLLTPGERAKVGRAALGMKFADPASPRLDGERLGDWLGARGQGERARRRLWDLFVIASLNIAGDDASTALAATVIKTGLLGRKDAADIGVPAIPLGDLHGKAAQRLLDRLGADVRLGVKAVSIEPVAGGGFRVRAVAAGDDADRRLGAGGSGIGTSDSAAGDGDTATGGTAAGGPAVGGSAVGGTAAGGTGVGGMEAGGSLLTADAVVLAVPAWLVAKLAPAGLTAPGPASTGRPSTGRPSTGRPSTGRLSAAQTSATQWGELGVSPIINVHVHYSRRVTRLPFAAALDSPVQWVFDKTRAAGVPTGQYLAVSLSAADSYVDVPAARLKEQFLPAMEQLFPAAADASVLDFFVTRERRATFRQVPGSGRLRPGAATSVPGLALAGAWTDTGWPDTMEGAVRSGQNAAEHIIGELTAASPVGAMPVQRVRDDEYAAGASS